MTKFVNRLLTIPFFIFLFIMPLGILLILSSLIPPFYGDWCFRQWEKKRDEEDVIDFYEEEF